MTANDTTTDLEAYNKFCKSLYEGCILYNIDSTNSWGEYLLVVNITTFKYDNNKLYSVLLIGLIKDEDKLIPDNRRINLTPDCMCNIHFLKYVGYCNFTIVPEMGNTSINSGLADIYGNVNLKKYAKNLSIRKPRKRKYGNDGKPFIKETRSE